LNSPLLVDHGLSVESYYCPYAYIVDFLYILGMLSSDKRECFHIECNDCWLNMKVGDLIYG